MGNTDLDSTSSFLPIDKYDIVQLLSSHPISNWASRNGHQLEQWSCLDRNGQPHHLHASPRSESLSQKCEVYISAYLERDTRLES